MRLVKVNKETNAIWICDDGFMQAVPTALGKVVETRDEESGVTTSLFRRDDSDHDSHQSFVFVHHDVGEIYFAKRCVLLFGQDLFVMCDALEEQDYPFAHDERSRMIFVGVSDDDQLEWLSQGAQVLWDSTNEDAP